MENKPNTGWFSLNRKIFENELWFLEPFTKAQAWIDLIGNANHDKGIFQVRGNIVAVERGQIGWSEVTMAKRWMWSREKVRRFLRMLEMRQQIRQQKSNLTTLITIINYNEYQTTNKTAERQQTLQQKDSRRDTNNNDNKENNDNKKESVRKFSSIKDITSEVIGEIANQYSVEPKDVEDLRESMVLFCQSKGKTYRNYKAALQEWVRRRIKEGSITIIRKGVQDELTRRFLERSQKQS
jgi:hypothetical protein